MNLRRLGPAAIILLTASLSLSLSSCSADADGAATAGDPASRAAGDEGSSDDPTDVTTEPSESGAPSAGDTTAPGTELSFGDAATIELTGGGVVEYAVTGVRDSPGGPLGKTWLIDIDVHAVTDLTSSLVIGIGEWTGLGADGTETVLAFDDRCGKAGDFEVDTLGAGEDGKSCVAVQRTSDAELAEIHYTSGDYRENPIVWTP
jgi:hypothetical protein